MLKAFFLTFIIWAGDEHAANTKDDRSKAAYSLTNDNITCSSDIPLKKEVTDNDNSNMYYEQALPTNLTLAILHGTPGPSHVTSSNSAIAPHPPLMQHNVVSGHEVHNHVNYGSHGVADYHNSLYGSPYVPVNYYYDDQYSIQFGQPVYAPNVYVTPENLASHGYTDNTVNVYTPTCTIASLNAPPVNGIVAPNEPNGCQVSSPYNTIQGTIPTNLTAKPIVSSVGQVYQNPVPLVSYTTPCEDSSTPNIVSNSPSSSQECNSYPDQVQGPLEPFSCFEDVIETNKPSEPISSSIGHIHGSQVPPPSVPYSSNDQHQAHSVDYEKKSQDVRKFDENSSLSKRISKSNNFSSDKGGKYSLTQAINPANFESQTISSSGQNASVRDGIKHSKHSQNTDINQFHSHNNFQSTNQNVRPHCRGNSRMSNSNRQFGAYNMRAGPGLGNPVYQTPSANNRMPLQTEYNQHATGGRNRVAQSWNEQTVRNNMIYQQNNVTRKNRHGARQNTRTDNETERNGNYAAYSQQSNDRQTRALPNNRSVNRFYQDSNGYNDYEEGTNTSNFKGSTTSVDSRFSAGGIDPSRGLLECSRPCEGGANGGCSNGGTPVDVMPVAGAVDANVAGSDPSISNRMGGVTTSERWTVGLNSKAVLSLAHGTKHKAMDADLDTDVNQAGKIIIYV